MAKIRVKGHELESLDVKSASNRLAMQFKNKILENLKKTGIKPDDVEVPLESVVSRKAKASVTWYTKTNRLYYSNNSQKTFIENLYLVSQLLEKEINLVLSGEKTAQEFIDLFAEEDDVDTARKEAREFLGVEHDTHDLETINQKYKELAKELHPDKPTGSTEKFKKLNHAHKMLKRELE